MRAVLSPSTVFSREERSHKLTRPDVESVERDSDALEDVLLDYNELGAEAFAL